MTKKTWFLEQFQPPRTKRTHNEQSMPQMLNKYQVGKHTDKDRNHNNILCWMFVSRGIQDLRGTLDARDAHASSHVASNYSSPNGSSFIAWIDRSILQETHRQERQGQPRRRRRRRRWKLKNCLRCTSDTGDEARNSSRNQVSKLPQNNITLLIKLTW